MIIILDDRHKADLQFIKDRDFDVIKEFVGISLEFLRKGSNPKLYVGASRALGVEVQQIEAVVESLAHLFSESSKLKLSDADFVATLLVLGFSNEMNEFIKQLFLEHQAEIRNIQQQLSFDLPHYTDLEWRLDIQLASRTVKSQAQPVFTLCLHINENGEDKKHYLQTDYANLKHLTDELELALRELKTPHVRRIMRNIK